MPSIQEFEVQAPSLLIETFFVELPAGLNWQKWEHRLLHGDQLEFWYEEEQAWLPAEVQSWKIEDGSGNAPGANAHFFLVVRRDGKKYKLDLDDDLRVRFEAPTVDELAAQAKHCEGIEIKVEGGRYTNEERGPCSGPGIYLVAGSWYCASCAPQNLERATTKCVEANRGEPDQSEASPGE
jgi:hypothetical protein